MSDDTLPILENWKIINYGILAVAEGNVYNSKRFDDGLYITTSWIKAYSLFEAKLTTNNTVYKLGKPALPPLAEHEVILKKDD